jgi:hypothetical protein
MIVQGMGHVASLWFSVLRQASLRRWYSLPAGGAGCAGRGFVRDYRADRIALPGFRRQIDQHLKHQIALGIAAPSSRICSCRGSNRSATRG